MKYLRFLQLTLPRLKEPMFNNKPNGKSDDFLTTLSRNGTGNGRSREFRSLSVTSFDNASNSNPKAKKKGSGSNSVGDPYKDIMMMRREPSESTLPNYHLDLCDNPAFVPSPQYTNTFH